MTKETQTTHTPIEKGIRTAYQTLVGVLPLLVAIVAIPEVKDAANGLVSWTAAIAPVVAGLSAWLQNRAGK